MSLQPGRSLVYCGHMKELPIVPLNNALTQCFTVKTESIQEKAELDLLAALRSGNGVLSQHVNLDVEVGLIFVTCHTLLAV